MGKFKNMLIDYYGNHFTMYILINSLFCKSFLNNTSLCAKKRKVFYFEIIRDSQEISKQNLWEGPTNISSSFLIMPRYINVTQY